MLLLLLRLLTPVFEALIGGAVAHEFRNFDWIAFE
jgi:hypothetical protein